MMRRLTRRDFLRKVAAALGGATGALFLNACGIQDTPTAPPTLSPTSRPLPTMLPSSSPVIEPTPITGNASTPPTLEPSPTATPIPDLVVARGGEPEDLVRRAVAALGGMEKYVHKGDVVVVKPNICVAYHTYEYAVTTNPWVVAAVVKLALEAGASQVKVMDYPFGGTQAEAYEISGIAKEVAAAGGSMENMVGYKYVKAEVPKGVDLRTFSFYKDILDANVVINLPIAKHHSAAVLTLGMKNLMGVVRDRSGMHANLGQRIADVASRVAPALTLVDAVRILTANGPTGGNLNDVKQLDTIIASPDMVAADSYATTLFGMKGADIPYIEAASKMGLGQIDLQAIKISEV